MSEAYPPLDSWVALKGRKAGEIPFVIRQQGRQYIKLPVNEILVVLVSKIITYESKKNTNSYLFNFPKNCEE